MISRVISSSRPGPHGWVWRARYTHGSVKSGRFEVHGLDPDAEVPVYFLDPNHQARCDGRSLGQVGGRRTGHRPAPALRHGQGAARSTPAASRSRVSGSDLISMVVTPGPTLSERTGGSASDWLTMATLAGIDPINYADGPVSDAQGRIAFPALIPGATYRLTTATVRRELRSARNSPSSPARRSTWAIS